MTIAIASRPSSSSGYWSPSSNTTPISKRKRTSCAFEADASGASSWSPSMMAASPSPSAMASPSSHPANDEVTPLKRSRTLAPVSSDAAAAPTLHEANTPALPPRPQTSPTMLSTSPSNVPFSSAFRAPSTARPPTIEEQQMWSSSSAQPTASPPAGAYASPTSTWTKVTTDYGHAWERSACEESMNEAGMALDDDDEDEAASGHWARATRLAAPSQPSQTQSTTSSLLRHIEGDSGNGADSDDNMMFDPDTGRRGDSIAWDADILQLKVPTSAHAHPYSPSAIAESSRAQLGATYFDQAVWQANQDRMMYEGP